MRKKLLTIAASLAILAGGIFTYFAIASPAEATSFGSNCGHRDYDSNAIVKGGACSTEELKNKIKGDVDNVYNHYGVPTSLSGAKKGEIRYNGDVVVDGKVVATGAQTLGRTKFGNSKAVKIDGKTYYQGSPQTRWVKGTKSMKAYVFFNSKGEYKSAVLAACGNPVTAKPKPQPKPQASYQCEALNTSKIDRTRFDLTVKTREQNATFKSVTFNIYKDGKKVASKVSASKTYRYTQTTPGDYRIEAVTSFTVNGSTKVANVGYCVAEITVESEPCPYNPNLPKDSPNCEEPAKPVYSCDDLTAELIGKVTDRSYKYNLEYTAKNGAELETVDFTFGDGKSKEGVTPSQLSDITHTYAKEGTYTAIATLKFAVGGSVKTDKCAVKITASPDKEEPCPYNSKLPKGDEKCFEPCPYNAELPKDSKDCEAPEQPATPTEPKGDDTPPAEIPKTGAESVIGAVAGVGSIGTAGWYYLASRRELMGKLLNR